jgi:hypothetical protein
MRILSVVNTPRQDIEVVRAEALGLHKRLIDAARAQYEAQHGVVVRPGEMLRLVAFDPEFAWLRPLTRLILEIDEQLESGEAITDADAMRVRAAVEEIFGRSGSGADSELPQA